MSELKWGVVWAKTEKIDHKNCSPREPNGQKELSSAGKGGEGSLGWKRMLFLLVANALFKALCH